jgi:aryl-alcohol dehydrogenase-like predicted oxidoreductase
MGLRQVGPFKVSKIGFGCMNLSHAYGVPPQPDVAEALLLKALDLGVNFFDTAALYGFGANEELVGRVLKSHRAKIILASKGGVAGVDGKRVIDGRPETLKRNCEDSLRRLQTEVIDLYYLHRWDKKVPVEDSIGALSELVHEGKVRALGLSEVSSQTLRRAHAVHPIVAVQTEYSLWTRNPEIAVLSACKEIGAAFVAFSPVARGFLTGKLLDVSGFDAKDIRRAMPRFQPENYAANLRLLDGYVKIAHEVGVTQAQLAYAWLLARGEHVVALQGTTSMDHLQENMRALDIALSADVIARLDQLINQKTVVGPRYNEANRVEVDTEEYRSACC